MADQSNYHSTFAWGSLNYGESLFGEFSLKRWLFRAEPEPKPETAAPASPERRQQWVEEEQEFNDRLLNLRYHVF